MSEITDTGYVAKTQNEYFEEEQTLYTDIDPDWNLDASTPDGLKIAHDAEIFANLDELLQQAYNSKDPNIATSLALDALAAITGTFRKDGTPSQATVTLTGTAGTLVGSGLRITSSDDGTEWTLDDDATIGSGGTVDVGVTCSTDGAIQADPDTLTLITDAVGGWESVTNSAAAIAGTDEETDAQLRLRRNLLVASAGNNQVDNMLGAIGNVEDTRLYRIYENPTSSADVSDLNPYGLPANSISPIVDGGTDDDVAQAIFTKKNPGVLLYQAADPVEVEVTSELYPQNTQIIRFSRPTYVDIVIVVEVVDDGSLPGDTEQLIKDAILDYVGGTLVAADCGFNPYGFNIGEDVPISRMYTPINQVIGQYGNSYVNTLTLNGGSTNVTIEFNELSNFTESNITVVVS